MKFYFLNILFSGLALGGVFVVRRYLNPPSLEDSSRHYLNFHQQILYPVDRYLMILSSLAALVALGLLTHQHVWTYLPTKLMMEGLICGLVCIVILFAAIRRIDRKFMAWSPEDPPEEWKHRRAQWLRWHTIQAIFSFFAFSFYLFAALVARSL